MSEPKRIAIVGWHGTTMPCGEPNVIGDVMQCMMEAGAVVVFVADRGEDASIQRFLASAEPALDAIVWWNWSGVSVEDMARARRLRPGTKMIMYNWDDPHCRAIPKHWLDGRFTGDLYDYGFVSARENPHLGVYAFPFETLYPPVLVSRCQRSLRSIPFTYNVYFACTNLYERDEDVKTDLRRGYILRQLSAYFGESFRLFGPDHIRAAAPASYREHIGYERTLVEPRYARVCINMNGADGDGYMNERLVTLFGCGALIVTNGVFEEGTCVLAQTDDEFVEAVKRCVRESDAEWAWTMRDRARRFAEEQLDTSKWVTRVLRACSS